MTSKLAMEDIKDITSKGGQVSPEDVILLNALGLKITNSCDCDIYTLPRFASLCGVQFREPSVGQEIFIQECCRLFEDDDATYVSTQAWVLAHTSEECDINLLRHPKLFALRVKVWMMTKLRDTTMSEIERVVMYCKYGCDPTTNEFPIYMIDEHADIGDDKVGEDKSWILKNYLESVSIGIDSVAALRATSPQLSAMIERAYIVRSMPLMNQEKLATKNYYMTLDRIKKKAFSKEDEVKQDGKPEGKD